MTPVFETILANATRLCDAKFGNAYLVQHDAIQLAATYNTPPAFVEFRKHTPPSIDPDTPSGRMLRTKSVVHIHDLAAEPSYRERHPGVVAAVELLGERTSLHVPMLNESELKGYLSIYRQEVRPFTDKQIELVKNFANQAVIAIENARLLNELRQSLQQQTATADVLKVISRSAFDLQAVLSILVESAARLCEADVGSLHRSTSGPEQAAAFGYSEESREFARREWAGQSVLGAGRRTVAGRTMAEGKIVHIPDVMADNEFWSPEFARISGMRTALGVPLMREGKPIGVISLVRRTLRPFTDKQIELVTTFADQAVIAIENVRLFDEVGARTRELSEALERQIATSEVLGVISSSRGELAPVFNAMLENAARICEADLGTMALYEDGGFRHVALHGASSAYSELRLREPVVHPHAEAPLGRLASTRQVVHVEDLLALPEHAQGGLAKIAGARTLLIVPLLKEQELVGIIGVYRQEVRPFAEKHIELVQNFADQAVIAIENTRLLHELREALQQQTATADVLKVIGRSTFDLQSVLDTLTESAARLCDADIAHITRKIGDTHKLATTCGLPPELVDHFKSVPIEPGRGTVAGRVLVERKTIQMADALADSEFAAAELREKSGARTILGVPLLREGAPIGVIVLMRRTVQPFTDKQIELVGTFADQAVIAIENARLFEEAQARNRDLTALGEVGRAVSSTLDLNVVLKTIVDRAVALSGADASLIFYFLKDTGRFELGETTGLDEQAIERYRRLDIGATETGLGEAITSRQPLQSSDITKRTSNPLRNAALDVGMRAALIVPLLGAEGPLGALVLQRRTEGEFPPAVISLMQSFADQSAIAVENARLFDEIAQKSRELEIASAHKSRFVANMSHELRTPLAAMLGYAELMEEGIYEPLGQQSLAALGRIRSNGKHLLGLINTVLDIAKIESGQFTLNMDEYAIGGGRRNGAGRDRVARAEQEARVRRPRWRSPCLSDSATSSA